VTTKGETRQDVDKGGAGSEQRAKPVSVQLYTLRDLAAKGFAAVLRQVADIGYAGVEPAGFYGLSAGDVRKIVEDLGMAISSSHGPWASPDNLNECVDTAGVLGLDLVSSGFGPEDFKTLDAIRRTAEKVDGMTAFLRRHGLGLFLHNHWWEFELVDGRLAYDHFAALCPDVRFEIDTYWAANFGANDPAEQVAKFRDRAPLLHIKDGPLVKDAAHLAVGQGKIDVPAVIAAADPRVLRWLVVELDFCATDMMKAVADSYGYLTRRGLARGKR